MKKFVIDESVLNLFPNVKIGILVCDGIDNHTKNEWKYAPHLRECEAQTEKYFVEKEFSENAAIKDWREAFRKFKTKKGARCSVEALLKRVYKGEELPCINPLVDIYNGISLKYALPVGGENIDKFEGDLRLTIATGGEAFVTYGSDKDEPALEGEVIYKDDAGAVCRCWNWRESVRTMLTEDVTHAFMIIETVSDDGAARLDAALDELKALIEKELGGTVRRCIASIENPSVDLL